MSRAGSESAFNPRVVVAVVAAGSLAFAAFLGLFAYADDFRSGRDGRGHPLSVSAIGFGGIVKLIELQGGQARLIRSTAELDSENLLVVAVESRTDGKALAELLDARGDRPFPQADLGLTGEAERLAAEGADEAAIATTITDGMARSRARDAAAGRSLYGPHRSDLTALHREKQRPAAEGSSGEQKALVLNLILAQATRLAGQPAPPLLLIDEAPAHLDDRRRAALFDEVEALGLQAFMTGTEAALFAPLRGRGQFMRVVGGGFDAD